MAETASTLYGKKVRLPSFTALFLFIFLLTPFILLTESPKISREEYLVSAVFLIIILQWLLKSIVSKRTIKLRFMDVPVFVLFVYFLFDFVKAISPETSLKNLLHWRMFFLLLIYFPVSRTFTTERIIDHFVVFLIFIGTTLSAVTIYFNFDYAITSVTYVKTGIDTSTFPFFILMFGIGIYKWVNSKNTGMSILFKILFHTSLIVMIIDILSFARRTPLIAITLSSALTLFFSLQQRGRESKQYLILLIAIPLFVITMTGLSESFQIRFSQDQVEEGIESRIQRFYYALKQVKEHYIIGIFPQHSGLRYGPYGHKKGSVHSLYFKFLYFGGIIGLTAFLFFMVQSLRYCFLVMKRKKSAKLKVYSQAITIVFLSLYVVGFASTRALGIETWICMGYLLGILTGIESINENEKLKPE